MIRLSAATLDRLPADIARPAYDRAAVRRGVVHLGIGAFHRAHQAALFDAALAGGDLRWGITGVSLRSPAVRDQLVPQDCLYTLVERDGPRESTRVIGAVLDVLVARDDPGVVVAAIASPETSLVTLTVTEKGYGLDRGSGQLLLSDPDVVHDLACLDQPRTAAGFLAAGLARRRRAGLPPLTVMSCDNLPDNGSLLRAAVLGMAQAHDPALADWVTSEVAFPSSMVDRIVPATTDGDVAAVAGRLCLEDRGTVGAEPFWQWVVEDRFAGPRPDFAALGVTLAADVAPWEAAKLRLLNGAHSAISYLGGLAGDRFVHDFVGRSDGRAFVEALWDEAAATLTPPPGLDLASYRIELMARFANSALRHRNRQIAIDGSQKVPQRLVAPLVERRAAGLPADALGLAVAAWMRWQGGADDSGACFVVDDPLAAATAAALASRDPVAALLGLPGIFPPDLAADEELKSMLEVHLAALADRGVAATLASRGASGEDR